MDTILILVAGPLFLCSVAAHIYVKIRLRPRDSEVEDYYHEFEDKNPAIARYSKWSQITFAAVVVSALMLFLTIVF